MWALRIAVFCLLVFASSIAVHELVHAVQFTLDPRLEFAGFGLYPECIDAQGHMRTACTYSSYAGDYMFTEREKEEYQEGIEQQAYAIQLLYIIGILYIFRNNWLI